MDMGPFSFPGALTTWDSGGVSSLVSVYAPLTAFEVAPVDTAVKFTTLS